MISVDIIEDVADIRNPLKEFLSIQNDILFGSISESVEEYLNNFPKEILPDVLILDIGLPGISGLSAIEIIKEKLPETEIIMFTVHDEPGKIFDALKSGASGYLLKNTPLDEIKRAVIEAANNGAPMSPSIARQVIQYFDKRKTVKESEILTPKERQIVNYIVDGQSYKMIAANLNNSIETIKYHTKNIYKKLHVNSKTEVVAKAFRGEI
ncbi:MAG: response regulator transcription factor [Ignavibacteriae bacterium]|nr:response regulator transcription factor [Ignavibacteriota bacterium]MCB9207293.1 response regulator transcription factor [Ignavibacteriales bacterium]MCB9210072.1 response regulator transcription factor [Ignavibacteriales bacterium]MCB9218543.1 response regulator transcription factor [Ignavibacteriales bacterium]MCB9259451.1 response regulator transcription factor [Ignavibacteriales bacterium]